MKNTHKSWFINIVITCLLFLSCTPNPVEEAKIEMQKEYHAYFDNTINMIEQYNWVQSIDLHEYWYPEGTTAIEAANDLETVIQGCRRLSKEVSTIDVDDEWVIFAKQELQQVLNEKIQKAVSITHNPFYGLAGAFIGLFANSEATKEEAKIPKEIINALNNLQNSLQSKMDISNDIIRMRDNVISNKELNKKQFIEINNAILTMARDSFLNHFQGWKGVESYFDKKTNNLKDSTYINNIYQFFHASAEAIKELKKHHLYDEQTTQMYTGFYAEADAYCEPVDKATDDITSIYKGNGFIIDYYSNALDGEGELYWNIYSYQEKNNSLTLRLKKTFLYDKNNYSVSMRPSKENNIGSEYIYKSLSCGENSYAGIHTSKKGEKYAIVWIKNDEIDKYFLKDLFLCKEVIAYLTSNECLHK